MFQNRQIPYLRILTNFAVIALFHSLDADTHGGDQPLFDGRTFHGWTTLDGKPIKEGWEVVDGMIHRTSSRRRAGDIVTEREYGDLELSFEWKISKVATAA